MNLVIEKLTEINEALRKFKAGQMTPEQVQAFVSLVNSSHRWANLTLQAYAIESKNRRVMKGMEKSNILDDHTALAIGLPEELDKVKCREKEDGLITMEECLDYSGSHNDDCDGCELFSISRRKLIDEK